MRLPGIILILLSLIVITPSAMTYFDFQNSSQIKKFEKIWANDLESLAIEKKLPKNWSEIAQIELLTPTDLAHSWSDKLNIPIKLNSKGTSTLELIITDWSANKSELDIMVQYKLKETVSKNILSDFGRTYRVK